MKHVLLREYDEYGETQVIDATPLENGNHLCIATFTSLEDARDFVAEKGWEVFDVSPCSDPLYWSLPWNATNEGEATVRCAFDDCEPWAKEIVVRKADQLKDELESETCQSNVHVAESVLLRAVLNPARIMKSSAPDLLKLHRATREYFEQNSDEF